MSWRDRYLTASFRGVEFKVQKHDATFGRRQVVYEYPQRDTPSTEDLGRRARELSLDAYVIGEDYHLQRDRLIAGGKGAKIALGALLIVLGVMIVSGLDRRLETVLVDWSPLWLTNLTTRF